MKRLLILLLMLALPASAFATSAQEADDGGPTDSFAELKQCTPPQILDYINSGAYEAFWDAVDLLDLLADTIERVPTANRQARFFEAEDAIVTAQLLSFRNLPACRELIASHFYFTVLLTRYNLAALADRHTADILLNDDAEIEFEALKAYGRAMINIMDSR